VARPRVSVSAGYCSRGRLDMGNSGTSTRLLMGLVASPPGSPDLYSATASLSGRPMGR